MKRKFKVIGIIIAVLGLIALFTVPSKVTYERQDTIADDNPIEEVIEKVQRSEVEEAEEMLRKATEKLDIEEARLLEEIAEREAKIEEINKVRSSF